jgi:hypothetical protein
MNMTFGTKDQKDATLAGLVALQGLGLRTNAAGLMPKRSRITLATVRRLALAFPGVEEGLSYGTPGFRVRGRFLARLWEDGETLVVKCGDDERDFRMKADPETFFSTDHYRGYPTVLVRLASVTKTELQGVLEQAWRLHAPQRLVREYDQTRKS